MSSVSVIYVNKNYGKLKCTKNDEIANGVMKTKTRTRWWAINLYAVIWKVHFSNEWFLTIFDLVFDLVYDLIFDLKI